MYIWVSVRSLLVNKGQLKLHACMGSWLITPMQRLTYIYRPSITCMGSSNLRMTLSGTAQGILACEVAAELIVRCFGSKSYRTPFRNASVRTKLHLLHMSATLEFVGYVYTGVYVFRSINACEQG